MKSTDHINPAVSSSTEIPNSGKRISLINRLEFQPLFYALQKKLLKHPFELIYSEPVVSATRLKDGEVELALIPSIEYARAKETWNIIPGIGIGCAGSSLNMQLFFRKGLKDLKTIAVDNQATSTAILLKILMREKFSASPDYLEMPVNLEQMLGKADAALITGDQALWYYHQNQNRLDINEEWVDLTGFPFIYSFWAGREFTISSDEVRLIQQSFDLGKRNLEYICKEFAGQSNVGWAFFHDFLIHNLSYGFSEKEKAGLLEFYNYAFFFGYIDFIPELHFYPI